MSKLIDIQNELHTPKSQTNNFGGYNYRSAEQIYQAVKPLLKKYKCELLITDEIVMIGERYYIKSTATFIDGENVRAVTAYAREPEMKKGMDSAQVTGTASSYARKYALGGLFLLDDSKIEPAPDPDTQPPTDEPKPKKEKKTVPAEDDNAPATDKQREYIAQLCEDLKLDKRDVCDKAGVERGKGVMTVGDYHKLKNYLESYFAEME